MKTPRARSWGQILLSALLLWLIEPKAASAQCSDFSTFPVTCSGAVSIVDFGLTANEDLDETLKVTISSLTQSPSTVAFSAVGQGFLPPESSVDGPLRIQA